MCPSRSRVRHFAKVAGPWHAVVGVQLYRHLGSASGGECDAPGGDYLPPELDRPRAVAGGGRYAGHERDLGLLAHGGRP